MIECICVSTGNLIIHVNKHRSAGFLCDNLNLQNIYHFYISGALAAQLYIVQFSLMKEKSTMISAHIKVRGIVQGVGFRPFIFQMATACNLKGWVCNTSENVLIEAEGTSDNIETFVAKIKKEAPPLARIEKLSVDFSSDLKGHASFEIRPSIADPDSYQPVSPDIATCHACRKEIFDSSDRRFHYPFTNCTNCGPRFTIIKDMPYDRPSTTMHRFTMCERCQAEYDNPLDRRFHAQPNACPVCGPQLSLVDARGHSIDTKNPLVETCKLLKEGKIIAIKGLGGFQLACDATRSAPVSLLRERKRRPAKPFAVMVKDMKEAARHCYISDDEQKLLTSHESPIVLLERKPQSTICKEVAPGIGHLGIMLPYTPLHHLLLNALSFPLIMTSGNLSEEPIAQDNDEALKRLAGIADYFLMNNRDIYSRYDDTVAAVERGGLYMIRRSRGYAPDPIPLTFRAQQVLGCGAEEKNTFCITREHHAFLSQHIGDLENMETLEHYENTIELYKKLFRLKPQVISYDMHPEYLSTKYALESGEKDNSLTLVPVQHHHAHIVSCMADNSVTEPVIGVALDGTGYGNDGRIWGGEFMVADYSGFMRAGHLEYLPVPGGEAAIKKPWRLAAGYILTLLGENASLNDLPILKKVESADIDLIRRQLETRLNTPLTSSMGRLFDAVSAMLGIRGVIYYEAQAACELEAVAGACTDKSETAYSCDISNEQGISVIRIKSILEAIIDDLRNGRDTATIAHRFHITIARIVSDMCVTIRRDTGIRNVALSGGVFQNRLLLKKVVPLLEYEGFTVYTHRRVPCNDGGISLGQAVIANYREVKNVFSSTG